MMPIGPLMVEHRWIEKVIFDLQLRLDGGSGAKPIDPRYVDTVVDFLRTYADRCHHGKEEDILFRELAERDLGSDLAATMKQLLADHAWARTISRSLIDANAGFARGDEGAEAEVRRLLGELAGFYPRHIKLEDDEFFRPIMELFSADEKAAMLAEFSAFDAGLIHEKYRGIAEGLQA